MAKVRLTAVTVKALTVPGEAVCEYADEGCPGLRLRVAPSGKPTWNLNMRDPSGRMRRFSLTLGGRKALTLAEARTEAGKLRADVERGADPVAEKRAAKASMRQLQGRSRLALPEPGSGAVLLDDVDYEEVPELQGLTLVGLLVRYGEKIGPARRSWAEAERSMRFTFANLLDRPVAALTPAMIRLAVDDHPANPGDPMRGRISAGRAVDYLRPVLKWGAERELVPELLALKVTKIKDCNPTRDRVLDDRELAAVLAALDTASSRDAMLKFLLLTACRLSEAAELRWREIDFEDKVWHLPAERAKNECALDLPLSRQVCELLEFLRPEGVRPDMLVFPSEGGHVLSNWDREGKRLQARSGTSGWHRHDLRRTVVTGMSELGILPHVVEAVVNHISGAAKGGVAGVYNRAKYAAPMRDALQQWADHIDWLQAGATITTLKRA